MSTKARAHFIKLSGNMFDLHKQPPELHPL